MSSSPPTPYSTITVSEVSFTGNTGPVEAEGVPPFAYGPGLNPNFSTSVDAFVVGIHAVDPPIGSGDPQSRDSLIGFKILETGEYTDIEVPIFPYRPDIGPAQVFPPTPDGTTEIKGTLWHDVGLDYGATQGVIQIDGSVNASANITDLDQNANRKPIGQAPRDPIWNFVGERGPKTFAEDDDPRFGEAVAASIENDIAAGAPLEDHSTGDGSTSTNVGSTYVVNGIFEEIEPGEAGLPEVGTGDNKIDEGAQFGSSVAIWPEIAVGAPNDDGGRGVVYIFLSDGEGSPIVKTISGDSPGDDLGAAVDVTLAPPETDGGDPTFRVLAGAPNAGTGGKVKVVDIDDMGTTLVNTLSPAGLGSDAEFGASIGTPPLFEAGPGSPALIGAPGAAPNEADDAGKAYLYETVSSGAPTRELTASPSQADDRFGSSVDLDVEEPSRFTDDTEPDLFLSVGAPGDSNGRGEVYLFEIEDFFSTGSTNLEEKKLSDDESSPGDKLGAAVALTDNQNLVAGAPDGGYATLFDDSGAVDHFTRPGDVPSFGTSVATSFGRVVIGAPDADGGGAAFIYERPDGGDSFTEPK